MVAVNPETENIVQKCTALIANLTTIASIKNNDKLYIDEQKIVIQPYYSTRGFIRWWNNYNRLDSINFINKLYNQISSTIIILTSISNKHNPDIKKRNHKKIKKKYRNIRNKLIKSCTSSTRGLMHLMITYQDDAELAATINNILILIDKLN